VAILPDFLGIGAQKAGTTWLYQNLRHHPGVWLPPQKELHYFDEKVVSRRRTWHKLFGETRQDVRWRADARHQWRALRRSFSLASLRWSTRYLLRRPDDRWYASLFAPGRGKLIGEITPDYALLEEDGVAHVRRLVPDARLFFLIRNPIERGWSHALMQVLGERRRRENVTVDLSRHFGNEGSRGRSDYLRTIDLWLQHFSAEQLFIGFTEDIHFHPRELLSSVCTFLGVDDLEEWPFESVRVYSSGRKTMPLRDAIDLAHRYEEQIGSLAERFGGYADWWQFAASRLRTGDWPESDDEPIAYPLFEGPLWNEFEAAHGRLPLQSGRLAELAAKSRVRDRPHIAERSGPV
jgi:hypothetical protein